MNVICIKENQTFQKVWWYQRPSAISEKLPSIWYSKVFGSMLSTTATDYLPNLYQIWLIYPGAILFFKQDRAGSQTAKHTMAYFDENLPEQAEILLPEDWPPHSPDLNPMDYCIWSSLARKVFKVKIRDVHHLCDRLGEAWEELSQEDINRVIKSFRKRLKACAKAHGKRSNTGWKRRNIKWN